MEPKEIPNVLACDVGNSRVRVAHVRGEEVTEPHVFPVGQLSELGPALATLWAEIPEPKKLAAASVHPAALKALEAAASEAVGQDVLVVGRDLPLPIDTRLPHPESIGTDRLCCAAAAFDRLGAACIVADFGTAITIDCVDDEGVFLGGAILPGLAMGARALAGQTAQLPEITPASPEWTFGQDTRDAIIGGLVFGARGALRHLIEAYATALGTWPTVILTGGDAELICANLDASDLVQAIVPDLSLRGVAMAYYRMLIGS